MYKVLHADPSYLWKIPLRINLYEGIHFLLVAVYWFVVKSSSITHEKGFSKILRERVMLKGSECTDRQGVVCPPGGTASSGSDSFTVLDMRHVPAVKENRSVQIFTARGRKCGQLARG